jgi:ribosomal protein S18 acetylase RimI-like enzyme
MIEYRFENCDFSDSDHLSALADLLNHYMTDPMGDHAPHTRLQQLRLVDGLANHPSALVLFVKSGSTYAGLAVCFINFSTFNVKPFLNIHDLIIHRDFRGQGLGRALLEELVRISKERDYCKLTLEVRSDNNVAKGLYQRIGFTECEPPMHFWNKKI